MEAKDRAKDKLIQKLEGEKIVVFANEKDWAFNRGLNVAIELVKNYNPWISVSDHYPTPKDNSQYSEEVLVITENGIITAATYSNISGWDMDFKSESKVTAWMPLPLPPKQMNY